MDSHSQSQDDGLSPIAVTWLQERIGAYRILRSHRTGSQRTGVWQLETANGQYYFKLNRRRVRWGTEVFAYRNWMEALQPYVPELLGVLDSDGLNGMLLSALDGITLRESGLTDSDSIQAYRKAGELLATLHSLSPGPWFGIMDENGQPTDDACHRDPVVYYGRSIRRLVEEAHAAKALNAEEEQLTQTVLEALTPTLPPPVPTFFDYTPGNWIVNASGQMAGIIDFENMGWALRADPFTRLVLDYFPLYEESKEAFYAGYGCRIENEYPEQLRIGCLIYGLYYKTCAVLKSDAGMAERARRAFAACKV